MEDDKKEYYSRTTSVNNNILNQSNDSKNIFGSGSSNLIKIISPIMSNDEIHNLRESVNGTNNQFSNGNPIFIDEQFTKQSVFVSARNLSSVVGSGKKEKKILTDLNFFLKPGSMVLLLGSPGCGKTSLMNTLSLLTSSEKITGNLLFNGKIGDKKTHHRHVSYIVQDDSHIGPLTVRDTLKFSADCQLGDRTEKERVEKVESVLDFLGLEHVQKTVIGDNFLRGISGGQKKRVTIGVELVKDSNLLLMDEPTNGLDSSISLEILTKIKNKVNEEKLSCLVSLLQPGLEITKLFDYLMIMNQGQMIYFGPMNQGIGYFESLGFSFPKHHNPAEFFQEIVDEPELYYTGEDNNTIDNQRYSTGSIVPPLKGANDFAQAFIKSEIYKSIISYIDRNIPNMEEQKEFIDYSSLKQYSISFPRQLHLNVIRGFKIQIGNPNNLFMRLMKNVVIGFILGTLFWKLGRNQDDANNKSGLLFFSLLSFIFGGFSSISVFFAQRDIYYHQKSWKYYDSMAYFFSMVVNDIPLSILEVIIFSNFIYWMTGLNQTWDRFIYFMLMCFLNDIFSHALLKMICSFSPNNAIATSISPALVSPFLLLCGYMKKKPQIPNYWVWIYWISPIHYGFEGLLLNEHSGVEYHCNDNQLMPPKYLPTLNSSYPIGFEGSQVCPITNGEQVLDSLGFATNLSYRWIDLAIVGGFIVIFWTITAICMRILLFRVYRKDPVGIKRSTTIKSKRISGEIDGDNNPTLVPDELKKQQQQQQQQKQKHEEEMEVIDIKSSGAKLKKNIPNGCFIQWKDLIYEVDVKKKGKKQRLRLLNNINGYVKPGMLLALMGPSGAGKSTLLDVLANRKTGGHIKGQILINGEERSKHFTRIAAYVEQSDILSPMLTVKEVILFRAKTRLPISVSDQEKEAFVDNILETLNLVKIQHSLIGEIEGGLSLSQRKRTNMGIELASDPQLLFLDEPTSGLDSSAALKVMNLIKKIASSGRSIICTIHQPSTTIFKKFDHLLLLKKGGETVYFGPTGKDSCEVLNYFSERGLVCDPFKNPADFILDVTEDIIEIPSPITNNLYDSTSIDEPKIDATTATSIMKSFDPVQSFKESEENKNLILKIQHSIMPSDTPLPVFHGKYSSSLSSQIKELMARSWKASIRRKDMIRSRIGRTFILGIVIGTLFLRMKKEQVDVYSRISLLFFSLMFGGMAGISMIPMVTTERGVFYREQSSGMYRVWIYYLSFIVSDLPWVVLSSYAYVIPAYFLTGLTLTDHGWSFFYHSFVSVVVYLNFELFAIFLTSVLPIQEMAFLINGVTLSLSSLFAGFMITPRSMPKFWKWLYHIDFISYPLKSYLITELKDMEFVCTDDVGAIPIPIPSQNTTKFFCPITKGTQILENVDFNVNLQYWSLLIMSAFTLFFLLLGFLSFKFIRYQNK